MEFPRDLGRVAVLSPHCDDGVFGCGQLLAAHPGAVVVTVFAGSPPAYGELTEWDRACGFREGDDVMALRRAEDAAALDELGAVPHWLDFCDSQYRRTPSIEILTEGLARAIDEARADTVVFPLGLFHSDHRLAHEAALEVLRRRPALHWFAYEDALYRCIEGLLEGRLAALFGAGLEPTPVELPRSPELDGKRRAMNRYASQLRALASPGMPGFLDAFAPEGYWRVAPRPALFRRRG